MKYWIPLIASLVCIDGQAQNAEFNPLKELQTIPNAARITVTASKMPLFNVSRRISILADGERVAEGDSDNPATFEVDPGKEFVLEVCFVNRNGDIVRGWCSFGGVMRPTNNTLYKFNYRLNEGISNVEYLGKQGF
jgi:hypothetical protein